MEELRLLIEMVSNLPQLAVWVLIGYLVYKITIVGSIYALVRFVVQRVYDAWRDKHTAPVDVRMLLDGVEFDSTASRNELIKQLTRLKYVSDITTKYPSRLIHGIYGVKDLRECIDKIEQDSKK